MTEFVVAPKKAIAIAVMICFIIVCVLAPFGAAHAIVGISTAAVTILIAALAAAGITFTTTGAFDTLEEYVESLLQEYAQDNNIPVTSVFNGASWQASAAGKLLLNNMFVREISAIATWIKLKFNLYDNTTNEIITPGVTFGNLTVANLPFSFISQYNEEMVYTVISGSGYAILSETGATTFSVVVISDIENTAEYHYIYNGRTTISQYRVNVETGSGYWRTSGSIGNSFSKNDAPIPVYTDAVINAALASDSVIEENNIGIGINTGSIDIPTDRIDYTDTAGAILDVNAPWSIPVSGVIDTIPDAWSSVEDDTTIYTLDLEAEAVIEQQLPQPSDIENLPGATIPGIPDIDGEPWHLEFSNLWHYVAQWISDMSAGGAVIWNTCVQAPPPVVNLVFVGIVLAMWFGAIKILR